MAYRSLAPKDGGPPADPARSGAALWTLLLACAATALLWFVPYAALVTYPIRLLVTFLHEGGHALAALATGGAVRGIEVYADGSGVTWTQGGLSLAVVSAGYLGATLYGALLIALLRRGVAGRTLLLATGIWVGLLTVGFVRPWSNPFGFFWGIALAAALLAAARALPPGGAHWTAAFVGIQCGLNALFDLRTLLRLSWGGTIASGGPAVATDAALLSRMIPLPPVVWAMLWLLLSVAVLGLVLLTPSRRRPAARVPFP